MKTRANTPRREGEKRKSTAEGLLAPRFGASLWRSDFEVWIALVEFTPMSNRQAVAGRTRSQWSRRLPVLGNELFQWTGKDHQRPTARPADSPALHARLRIGLSSTNMGGLDRRSRVAAIPSARDVLIGKL